MVIWASLPLIFCSVIVEGGEHYETFSTVTFGPTNGNVVAVGSALSLDRDTGFVRAACEQLRNVAKMFTYWLNRVHGGVRINGTSHPLRVTLVDDKGTTDGVTEATKYLVEEMGVKLLLGPASSTLNGPAAAVANSSGALMVTSNAASPSVFAGRPHVFGILTPAPVWQKPAVDALAAKGMKTIGYMFEDQPFQNALCLALPAFAEAAGVSLIKVIEGPESWTTDYDSAVLEMQAADPDVVFVCAYENAARLILQSMRDHDFAPKMVVFGAGLFAPEAGEFSDYLRFVAGLELWSKDAPLSSPWASGMTASSFAQSYFDHYGSSPTWFGSTAWAGLEAMVQAIETANSLNVDAITKALSAMDIQTLYGQVKFNDNNQNINDCKVIQYSASSTQAIFVAPMNTEQFIYPMPSWSDRKCLAVQPDDSIFGYAADGTCMACPQVAKFNWISQQRECESCAADEEAVELLLHGEGGSTSNVRQCKKVCSEGWVVNASGLCAPCDMGYIAFQRTCVPCPLGTFNDKEGQVQCEFCPLGAISNTLGQIACYNCTPGFFSEKLGGQVCKSCSAGTFSTAEAATKCEMCPFGRYSSIPEAVNCSACEKGATMFLASTSESDCVCPSQQYATESSTCKTCPKGMECALGSDVKNYKYAGSVDANIDVASHPYPILKAGYWSPIDDVLSVYQCESISRCPGGDPGECAVNLEKACCSHCKEGWRWTGTQCDECNSFETSRILFPIMPVILSPLVIILLYKKFGDPLSKWNSWQNGCATILFVVLNHYQVISLMATGKIEMPNVMEDVFGFWDFSNDVLSLLHIDCNGITDITQTMLVKALGPIMIAGMFLLTFGACYLMSRAVKPGLAMERDRLFNVYGSIMYTFAATIAAVSMSLFKCTQNPNGKETLASDLSVICYDSDVWKGMLGIAIVACLLYVIGFGALIIYVLIAAVEWFRNSYFQMRWKFLLIKYRPTVWWWSVVFLIKQFTLNLSAVIFPAPMAQFFSILTITIAYAAAVAYYMPYRHLVVNAVELLTAVSITYASCVLIAIAYEKGEGTEENTLGVLSSMLSFTPLACAAVAMVYLRINACYAQETKRSKLVTETRDIVEACNLIIAMSEKEQFEFLSYLSEWDRWYVDQVWNFSTAELLAKRSERKRATTGIFSKTLSEFATTPPHESNKVDMDVQHQDDQLADQKQENKKLLGDIDLLKKQRLVDSLEYSAAEMLFLTEASPAGARTPPRLETSPRHLRGAGSNGFPNTPIGAQREHQR